MDHHQWMIRFFCCTKSKHLRVICFQKETKKKTQMHYVVGKVFIDHFWLYNHYFNANKGFSVNRKELEELQYVPHQLWNSPSLILTTDHLFNILGLSYIHTIAEMLCGPLLLSHHHPLFASSVSVTPFALFLSQSPTESQFMYNICRL